MRTLPRAVCLVLAAALSLAVVPASPALAAPGVDPASVELTLGTGESQTIAATVTTPPVPPRPDIVLLADTTGAMQPALANVSQNVRRIVSEVKAAQPEAQFAVAEYKEERNARAFHVNAPLTGDENAIAGGVQDWLLNVGAGERRGRTSSTPIGVSGRTRSRSARTRRASSLGSAMRVRTTRASVTPSRRRSTPSAGKASG